MADTIHQLRNKYEIMELPCATPHCEYHVTYNPQKPPTDAFTEYSYGSKIVVVFLDCEKPYDPHRNKYKIKI